MRIVVDFSFVISTFVTLSSMFSRSDSKDDVALGALYNFPYISIISTMLVTVIVFYGIKYIYKLTNVIFPVMLVIIFATIVVL